MTGQPGHTTRERRKRYQIHAGIVLALVGAFWVSRPSATVITFGADPGTLGAIPEYPPGQASCHLPVSTPKDVTFTVTVNDLAGRVRSVLVSMTFSPAHTFVGDLTATLIAPGGQSHVLFGRTGATTATGAGDSSDVAGPYFFHDNALAFPSGGGWWQAATAAGATVALPSQRLRDRQSR